MTQRTRVTVIVLVGVFVASLDLFIVNIAFPDLERDFSGSSLSGLSWVLNAYAIVFAALLVPAGRWADRSGRKRAFLGGLGLFTLASAACAAAPSVETLVAARVLQAAGGAFMLPTSLGLLLPEFPPERRAVAIGLWAAVGGVAAAAGPPIGGLLVEASWRWVFLVNLPIGLVTIVAGTRALREVRDSAGPRPDVLGAAALATGIAALVGAIVKGQDWGWGGGRVLGLLVLAVAAIALVAARSTRHPAPVVEAAILRVRCVALGNLAGVLFFAAFGAMILASVLFLTGVWHESVIRAGLQIAPGPTMAALFAVPGGLLGARYGQRVVGPIGALVFAGGGLWWRTHLGTDVDYAADFLPGMVIGGVGVGLVLPTLSAAATTPLPPARLATGTALLSMSRQVGIALGVAVLVAVLGTTPTLGAFREAYGLLVLSALAAGGVLAALGPVQPAAAPATAAAAVLATA